MDALLREKIERHQGWDYCGHERIRRFCQECKWDVPAYMRRGDPKHCELALPALDHIEPDYEAINAELQEAAEDTAEDEEI